jgi:hypothetical protein
MDRLPANRAPMPLDRPPDRPAIVTQPALELEPAPPDDPLEQLVTAVDAMATAWAYWITSQGIMHRHDAREMLGAAVDAVLIARNRLAEARHGR